MAITFNSGAVTAITPDTGNLNTDFITNNGSMTISGSISLSGSGSVSMDVILLLSGGSTIKIGTVTFTSRFTTTWSIATTTPIPEGSYTIELVRAGTTTLISAGATHALTVDHTKPTIGINAISTDDMINLAEHGSSVAISGTTTGAANGQVVTVKLNGVTYTTTVNNNAWTLTLTPAQVSALANGTYNVTAYVGDVAGNISTHATRSLLVNTSAPVPDISSFAAGGSPALGGRGVAGDSVSVYQNGVLLGTATVNAQGLWTYGLGALADGTYAFTSTETNVNGTSTPSSNLTVIATSGKYSISGGVGGVTFTGGSGADTITGGAGDDLLVGSGGRDVFNGGAGVNTLDYSQQTGGVLVDLANGYAYKESTAGVGWSNYNTGAAGGYVLDYLSNVSNVIGSNFDDRLYGTSGNNVFTPGTGNDIVYGQGGTDTVDYSNLAAGVLVNLANSTAFKSTTAGTGWSNYNTAIAAGHQTDWLLSLTNIIGTNFDDRLYGTSGNNVFTPGMGNDMVNGQGGTDTVSYSNLAAGILVNLANNLAWKETTAGVGWSNPTVAETGPNGYQSDWLLNITSIIGTNYDDRFYDSAAGGNTFSGGGGNDIIYGIHGSDVLNGGTGNDMLVAGAPGGDTMTGGAGADIFAFSAASATVVNTVADFEAGVDVIGLSNSVFGYTTGQEVVLHTGTGSNSSTIFNGTGAGFAYSTSTGDLWFNTDWTTGSGVRLATLTGAPTLTTAEFKVLS